MSSPHSFNGAAMAEKKKLKAMRDKPATFHTNSKLNADGTVVHPKPAR